jgi:hypothetical protein
MEEVIPTRHKEEHDVTLTDAAAQGLSHAFFGGTRCSHRALASRAFRLALATICLQSLMVGCSDSSPASREIMKVERQVSISPDHAVLPQEMTLTREGGYVITGSNDARTAAWASKVSASGQLIWEYLDGGAAGWTAHEPGSGRFAGAVELADRSVLLCGEIQVHTNQGTANKVGLLVRLAADGSLLDRRLVSPHGDQRYFSFFTRCMPWGDGAIVFGEAIHGSPGSGWLIRLNNLGQAVWETVDEQLAANVDALELQRGGLLVSIRAPHPMLLKLDQDGKVVARKSMPGQTSFARPTYGNSSIDAIVLSPTSGAITLMTLDQGLNVLRRSEPHRFFLTRAYAIADQSLILFGAATASTGGAAAAARLYPGGAFFVYTFGRPNESAVVIDASPVTGARNLQFVTLRTITHPLNKTSAPDLSRHAFSTENVLGWIRMTPRT